MNNIIEQTDTLVNDFMGKLDKVTGGCEKLAPKSGKPSLPPYTDLLDKLNSVIDNMISDIKDKLIEENPDEYYIGEESYGYYNNGVGMASCGSEKVYDEDRAWSDAAEKLAIDTANGGDDYELLFKEELLTEIAKYIRSR